MKSFTVTISNATDTYTCRVNATDIFTAQRTVIDYFIKTYGVGIISISIDENK